MEEVVVRYWSKVDWWLAAVIGAVPVIESQFLNDLAARTPHLVSAGDELVAGSNV